MISDEILDSLNLDYELIDDGPFKGLLSCSDAAAIWEIDTSAIRHAIKDYRLVPGKDCQKFGKQWVVTAAGMDKAFSQYDRRWMDIVRYLTKRRAEEQEKERRLYG